MKNNTIYRSTFSIVLPIGLLSILFIFPQWQTINENFDYKWKSAKEDKITQVQDLIAAGDKQRGAHVWGIIDSTDFQPLIQNNLEWITLISWGYQDDFDSPVVTHHNGDSLQRRNRVLHYLHKISPCSDPPGFEPVPIIYLFPVF